MTLALSMPVFAGEWKQDTTGWWYQNDDGSYPNNGWTWVDGRCYYFTPEGYCLINTQTPDGCTVDASGAWVVDGVVQTQDAGPNGNVQTAAVEVTVQMDNMAFVVPDGFVQDTSEAGGVFLYHEGQQTAIAYVSEAMPELGEYQEMSIPCSSRLWIWRWSSIWEPRPERKRYRLVPEYGTVMIMPMLRD